MGKLIIKSKGPIEASGNQANGETAIIHPCQTCGVDVNVLENTSGSYVRCGDDKYSTMAEAIADMDGVPKGSCQYETDPTKVYCQKCMRKACFGDKEIGE